MSQEPEEVLACKAEDDGDCDCSECVGHECWNYAQNMPMSTTLCCSICGAMFDRFGDSND